MTNVVERMQTVKELLKNDLQEYELIFMDAPTGAGKTTVMLNEFQDKSILYMVNRCALQEEIEHRVAEHKLENITVMTYQALEMMDTEYQSAILERFNLIVCDEAHYWVNDSVFNATVLLSFHAIMSTVVSKIIITATSQAVFNVLASPRYKLKGTFDGERELLMGTQVDADGYYTFDINSRVIAKSCEKYFCEVDASDYLQNYAITKFKFYLLNYQYRKDVHFHLVGQEWFDKNILGTMKYGKIIIFTDQIMESPTRRGADGYKKFVVENGYTASIVCSKGNRYTTSESLKGLTRLKEHKCFDTQCLISTAVIDNGIDIIDESVVAIFCDFKDVNPVQVQQCIGRVRLKAEGSNERYLDVGILEKTATQLATKETKLNNLFKDTDNFLSGSMSVAEEQQFVDSGEVNRCCSYINGRYEKNPFKYQALQYEKNCCRYKNHFFTLKKELGIADDRIESEAWDEIQAEKAKRKQKAEEIMNCWKNDAGQYVSQILTEEGENAVIELAGLFEAVTNSTRIMTLNRIFQENQLPIRIVSNRTKKKRYRTIEFATDERCYYEIQGEDDEKYCKTIKQYYFDSFKNTKEETK